MVEGNNGTPLGLIRQRVNKKHFRCNGLERFRQYPVPASLARAMTRTSSRPDREMSFWHWLIWRPQPLGSNFVSQR